MRNHNNRSIYTVFILFFIFCIWTSKAEYAEAVPGIPGLPGGIDSGAQTTYTTADGVSFESDYGRTGGISRTSAGQILNTDDDTLYHSRIVAPLGQVVTYRVSPPSGVSEMQIFGHFNEHYHQSAGARLIDVMIRCPGSGEPWNSGVMVEDGLDIFSAAGGRNTALVRDWGIVDVSGGEVEITLSPNSASPDAALISAIEFKGIDRIPNLPSGIDSGAQTAYTTVGGVSFESDYGRTGGISRTSTGEIHNTDDDTLYHSRIVAPLGQAVIYRLSAPPGVSEMRILGHFNEHYHQSAGARLIDVMIRCPGSSEPWNSGVIVEDGLDIFSEAGGRNTALVRDWGIVDVSGGEVEITLSANSDSPDAAMISAIEFKNIDRIPNLPGGIDSGAQTNYTTLDGITFESDYGRTGGISRTSTGEILNSDDDTLYHSRIVASLGQEVTYRVFPPSGVTEMRIFGHFNEHYHQSAGARLIDVMIRCPGSGEPWNSGVMVEDGLDIFSAAGGRNTALMRDWGVVDVSGGEVEITLSPNSASPDAALISAIEFN